MRELKKIIIYCTTPDPERLRTVSVSTTVKSWAYIGSNLLEKWQFSRALGNDFACINTLAAFDKIVDSFRPQYNSWIDNLNMVHEGSLAWWFGSLSSRNVYLSRLFMHLCHVELARQILLEEHESIDFLVVESPAVALSVKECLTKSGLRIAIRWSASARLQLFGKYILPFLRVAKSLFEIISRQCAAALTRWTNPPEKARFPGTDGVHIVTTFLHDASLRSDGYFADRYYPHLHEYFSSKNIPVAVLGILHGVGFNAFSLYTRMRKSETAFIIPEDYLGLSDIVVSCLLPFRTLRMAVNERFAGIDPHYLLGEERWTQPYAMTIQASLFYRLMFRMKQKGIVVHRMIVWYENQLIDKAMIAGARHVFPECSIAGAQLFIHPENFLNLYPIASEVKAGFAPDVLLATSASECARAVQYAPNLNCLPVASLRYDHVFSARQPGKSAKRDAVLVLLPFDLGESMIILETVAEVLQGIKPDIRVVIKGHPDNSMESLRIMYGKRRWPMRFEQSQLPLRELLPAALAAIASNSSAMIEAAIYGVPVLYLQQEMQFDQNLLSEYAADICKRCSAPDDIIEGIHSSLSRSDAEWKEAEQKGIALRDHFLSPVNDELLEVFIGSAQRTNVVL